MKKQDIVTRIKYLEENIALMEKHNCVNVDRVRKQVENLKEQLDTMEDKGL